MPTASVVLLGPQRHVPTVGDVVQQLGLRGPLGLITAGWLDREREDEELRAAIGVPARNLEVYGRAERAMIADPALLTLIRAFREKGRELRDLYRVRLAALGGAAIRLFAMNGDDDLLGPEREDAIEGVRRLDRHQLDRVAAMDEELWHGSGLATHQALGEAQASLARDLDDVETVIVAGGHVGELCLSLWLLQAKPLLQKKRVIAWSAGAMALGERIVLFHDSPPQGEGHSEVLRRGLGLYPDVLPLPHAADRLRLADPRRVSILARRFAEHRPVPLDARTRLDWQGEWRPGPETRVLTREGEVRRWE